MHWVLICLADSWNARLGRAQLFHTTQGVLNQKRKSLPRESDYSLQLGENVAHMHNSTKGGAKNVCWHSQQCVPLRLHLWNARVHPPIQDNSPLTGSLGARFVWFAVVFACAPWTLCVTQLLLGQSVWTIAYDRLVLTKGSPLTQTSRDPWFNRRQVQFEMYPTSCHCDLLYAAGKKVFGHWFQHLQSWKYMYFLFFFQIVFTLFRRSTRKLKWDKARATFSLCTTTDNYWKIPGTKKSSRELAVIWLIEYEQNLPLGKNTHKSVAPDITNFLLSPCFAFVTNKSFRIGTKRLHTCDNCDQKVTVSKNNDQKLA